MNERRRLRFIGPGELARLPPVRVRERAASTFASAALVRPASPHRPEHRKLRSRLEEDQRRPERNQSRHLLAKSVCRKLTNLTPNPAIPQNLLTTRSTQ
ncbi:hypothetical protein MHYP_G00033500 [Metynnis hypsauchen]